MSYYLANDRASACISETHYGVFLMEDLGQDISGSLQGAGGIGGLLSVTKSDGTYFPFADANGNIAEYVDTNGTIVAHYEFDPYGSVTVATGDKAGAFSYRFSSKPWDEETGSYYYGMRWYSPNMGRWLSRDPIGDVLGGALQTFVSNDPVGVVDPVGLYNFPMKSGCADTEKKQIADAFVRLESRLKEINRISTAANYEYGCCIDKIPGKSVFWGPKGTTGLQKLISSASATTVGPSIRCEEAKREKREVPATKIEKRKVKDKTGKIIQIAVSVPDYDAAGNQKMVEVEVEIGGESKTSSVILRRGGFKQAEFGPLQCVLLHEIIHSMGEDNETCDQLATTFCFEKKWGCKGYGINVTQDWGL